MHYKLTPDGSRFVRTSNPAYGILQSVEDGVLDFLDFRVTQSDFGDEDTEDLHTRYIRLWDHMSYLERIGMEDDDGPGGWWACWLSQLDLFTEIRRREALGRVATVVIEVMRDARSRV
jgi:hypothetical protein